MDEAREKRIRNWIRAGFEDATCNANGDPTGPGDSYRFEDELYWGVFIVDGDMVPLAMFSGRSQADAYATHLSKNSNTEYDVSPCNVDLEHRDNFEVPE